MEIKSVLLFSDAVPHTLDEIEFSQWLFVIETMIVFFYWSLMFWAVIVEGIAQCQVTVTVVITVYMLCAQQL